MRKAALFSLILLASPLAAHARPPVLVELFTAQGCQSCGEANTHVAKLADKPGLLVLTLPVPYWDYLGWPDTFAKAEFAERQKAYMAKFGLREPYTPQVVVDGHAQTAGVRTERVDKLVADAERLVTSAPDMQFINPRRVDVGSGRVPRGGADVWLVRYDPRAQEVNVRSGDNRGQTLIQRNVVREINHLGAWRGRPTAYRVPAAEEDGLKTVVVVQGAKGGRIIGVAEK